ncbi:peptidylprolyl isomerase [Nostoc punctiforme UO1]|uniref:peptidylprolyl isomerase n=1 Tax=Nostoc punctiforme TaxID=272131 RepID=UPI0030A95B7D
MSQAINITSEDILYQVKLSCKIPQIIEQIITRKIIYNAASEAGIKIETEEIQKAADQMRLMNKLFNAEDTWKWLEKYNLSLDEFEEIVYTNLLSGKLAAHFCVDKVEGYFYEHQLDYVGVAIYEVMLDDEDLIWELFYAIKAGETSFFDVAHKYIHDVELQRRCGYLGVVRRQDLNAEVSAAVFAAKPPQLLQPIVTAKGVHLIFIEEIIQPQLDGKVYQEIVANLYYQWLKVQTNKAEFNIQLD